MARYRRSSRDPRAMRRARSASGMPGPSTSVTTIWSTFRTGTSSKPDRGLCPFRRVFGQLRRQFRPAPRHRRESPATISGRDVQGNAPRRPAARSTKGLRSAPRLREPWVQDETRASFRCQRMMRCCRGRSGSDVRARRGWRARQAGVSAHGPGRRMRPAPVPVAPYLRRSGGPRSSDRGAVRTHSPLAASARPSRIAATARANRVRSTSPARTARTCAIISAAPSTARAIVSGRRMATSSAVASDAEGHGDTQCPPAARRRGRSRMPPTPRLRRSGPRHPPPDYP